MTDERPPDHEAEEDHGAGAEHDPRGLSAMSGLPALDPSYGLAGNPPSLNPGLVRMTGPMVERIRDEIPALAGSEDEDACPMLEVAAREAIRVFLNGARATESERRKVDELFRRLGHREATHDRDPLLMVAAMRVAGRVAWEHLLDHAAERHYSGAGVRDLSSALMAYVDHLREQLVAGYELASQFTVRDHLSRTRLLDFMINSTVGRISALRPLGTDLHELRRLADAADWPLPEQVVALAVSYHGARPTLPERPDLLIRGGTDRIFIFCPAEGAEELATQLLESGVDRRVALSWPVRPEEGGSALLWSARALDLVSLGIIGRTPLVRCADHVTQLWLQAEPSIRQRLCQELLEPLLGETPNSREILSDTLLAWLETRDSAPAIAARLDVHPQTVRYRWKRINEIFGDALHDPEFVLQMTMVLKTSLPMWKAGDQSDFERFRDRRSAGR